MARAGICEATSRESASCGLGDVRRAVDRLLSNPELKVDDALTADAAMSGPITFESRLVVIADLCRQLVRALRNLDLAVSSDERSTVADILACLESDMTAFRLGRGNDRK